MALYQKQRHLPDSLALLQLVANDSFKRRDYLTAAKAFDELTRQEETQEYTTGRRSACIGVVRLFTLRQCTECAQCSERLIPV